MDLTVGMRIQHTIITLGRHETVIRTGVIVATGIEHSEDVSRVAYDDGHWMSEYDWVRNDDPTLVVLS